jgi:predicted secreted protein
VRLKLHHKERVKWLLAAMLLTTLGSASLAQESDPVTISEAQNGNTITLSAAQSLIVRLPTNAGTGFSWALAQGVDAPLRVVKGEVEHPDRGFPGMAETQIFVLMPTGPGAGNIEFHYRRPWLHDQPPARIFSVRIVVSDHNRP